MDFTEFYPWTVSRFHGRENLKCHGRGVALVCAANHGLEIHEYAAKEIKKAVTGRGDAHKSQVQEMVRLLLSLGEVPRPADAADACAIAICRANRWA